MQKLFKRITALMLSLSLVACPCHAATKTPAKDITTVGFTSKLSGATDAQAALNIVDAFQFQAPLTIGNLTGGTGFSVSGGTGAVIGSGATISINSGYYLPTTADQTYWNGKQDALGFTPENVANKSTNTSLGTSDTLYPSQKAVKTYVDAHTPAIVWGGITGTLSNQTDLQTALNAKENTITAGTTSQYWRGDKTFQTLNSTAVGLGNVENTALSTWAGSSNLTTLGTIVSGIWQGTAIADAYIASAATWNAKQSALTFSTGLTNTAGTITVNVVQNITKLSNLTTNGIVKTSGSDGTLGVVTKLSTSDINWASITNQELQSSGFNWASVPANTIQKAAVNWSSVNGNVIQQSGINWQNFYLDSASANNWSSFPGAAVGKVLQLSTSGVNWTTVTSGGGSVTDVSVVTANGISGTVANSTTTPAITLALGNITPTSVNKVTITAPATSATLTIADGKTFTSSNTLTLAGTDGSTLNIGTGGTLGTAAYTAASAYEVPLTFSTGLTRTTNTITVNTTQNIAKLSNLTSNGPVYTSGGDGTLNTGTTTGSGTVYVLATSPSLTTPALGTPTSGVMTNVTGTATGLTSGITNALKSATTTIDVSAATAPTANQVLTATDSTHATWQTGGGGGGGDVTQATSGTQTSGNIPYWNSTAKEISKGNSLFTFNPTLVRQGVGVSSLQATSHNISSTAETLAPLATSSATLNLFTTPITPMGSYAYQATGHMYAVTSATSYQNSLGVVYGTSATLNYSSYGYTANGTTVDYVIYSKNTSANVFAGSGSSPFSGGADANDSSSYSIDLAWSGGGDTLTADNFRVYRQVNGGGYGEYQDVGNTNSFSDHNSGWSSGSPPPTPQITGFTANGGTHDYKIYQGGSNGSGGYVWSAVSAISHFGDNFSGNVYNVTITYNQNTTGTVTPVRYRIYRQINGGGYVDYKETASTTVTDDNTGWTSGSSPSPQYPDYVATGTNRAYYAYGRFLSPSGDNIFSTSGESYGFTDNNSGDPYVVSHSLSGYIRIIGSASGSASGYHIDTVGSVTEDSTTWISGDTVTPTTFGIQSDGSTLNRDYRFYNKGFTAGQNIYSAYSTHSVTDPNDGNYYYVTLAFTGYDVEAKIARSINGGGFGGQTHLSTTTFSDDGTTPFSDSATVGPTSVYPPAGIFGSPDSDTTNVPMVIVKSTTGTHPRMDFFDSGDYKLASIGVSAFGFDTNGLYLKDNNTGKTLAFSSAQTAITGPLVVDGPIKSRYVPISGGALSIWPNGSDVTAKFFGDYTGTQDLVQFFTSAGSATGYAKFTTTSSLNLRTGGTAAGTDPLKFTSGSLLTTPVAGVEEFLTDKRYTTITTGTARKEYTLNDAALTSTRVPFATTNGRITDDSDMTFATDTLTVTGLNVGTAKLKSYNGISTVSNGVASELATVDLTGQTAAKTATTIYTPTATGMYRISVYLQVTTAASTSSVLGGTTGVVITYNDGDGNVAQSNTVAMDSPTGTVVTTSATNTTATNLIGVINVYAKTGVAIQYAIGYTSVGATAMAYAFHAKCEAM